MRDVRCILLSIFVFFAAQLGAAQQSYILLDHQIHNFFVEKCGFNIYEAWEALFRHADDVGKSSLTQDEWKGIEALRCQMLAAASTYAEKPALKESFRFSNDTIERLVYPKQLEKQEAFDVEFGRIESIVNTRALRGNSDALGLSPQTGNAVRVELNDDLTDAKFIEELSKFIASFFKKKNLSARIKSAKQMLPQYLDSFWISPPPVCIKIVYNEDGGAIYFVGFPSEELVCHAEHGPVLLDSPSDVYFGIDGRVAAIPSPSSSSSSPSNSAVIDSNDVDGRQSYNEALDEQRSLARYWPSKKTLGACLLGALAVTGGVWAYQNREALSTSIQTWLNPNQCGCNVIAGPECTSPWEIRCRAENMRAGSCGPDRLGADDPTHFVVGKCSEGNSICPSKDFQPAAFVGGRDSNGRPYACTIENGLSQDLAFVGQIAPNAWYCPAGKSPFHFLKDGRLCLNTIPVIRAGVDAPLCDETARYCKLPDGLIIYRHGNDMLLRPPCGEGFEENGFKICKVDDLKLYRHEGGEYTNESPCDPVASDGVCIFDENLIEFYNPETHSWQDQPYNSMQKDRLFRFRPFEDQREDVNVFCKEDGECIVFKGASGSWTTKFPCSLDEGLCHINDAIFYSKKDSGVWIEGQPCSAGEEFFILQNGQVFYPHLDNTGRLECKNVPQWSGDCVQVQKGSYVGPDKTIFVPGKDAASWIRLSDAQKEGTCYFDNETGFLSRCDERGRIHYWHNGCKGYGWFDVPMCTGKECDGICQGSDGRIFILNDDLTEWILEPESCQHETELFCVDEVTQSVKYWHRGVFDQDGRCVVPGFWSNVPDCSQFADAGLDYCVGPDGTLFKLVEEFELLEKPEFKNQSQLFVFKYGKNFATWDPAAQKWLLNDAPCACNPQDLCCPLDDGHEIYAYQNAESRTGWSWDLVPHVGDGVDVIVCNKDRQPSPRWRQISPRKSVDVWREDGSKIVESGWTKVRQCRSCDRRYAVSRDVYNQALAEQDGSGRADIVVNPAVDPYTCRNVHVDNLSEYCPECRLQS